VWAEAHTTCQQLLDPLIAVVEYLLEHAAHEKPVREAPQQAERNLIIDVVVHLHSRASISERNLPKGMRMMPKFVRAAHLSVDERIGRIVGLDHRPPVNRHLEERQAIINHCAGLHLDRQFRHKAEVQKRRRDLLQVARVAEKSKNFVQRPANDLLAMEVIGFGH
jgi:hypothetical protein